MAKEELEKQLRFVREDIENILEIENPYIEVQKEVIKKSNEGIYFIIDVNEEILEFHKELWGEWDEEYNEME